jgi:glycine betaine/choline ABC-type transport system substrate-binding protein
MLAKSLIAISDLPEHAQLKLGARKNFRDRMDGKALQLFSNSGLSELIDDTGFGAL